MDQDSQRRQLGCPQWCCADHATADPQSEYIAKDGFTVYRERYHTRDVATVPNPGYGRNALTYVSVLIVDDLETGRSERPVVNVDGAECMSLATARVVAAAVSTACAILAEAAERG